jgi:hypothetical protein
MALHTHKNKPIGMLFVEKNMVLIFPSNINFEKKFSVCNLVTLTSRPPMQGVRPQSALHEAKSSLSELLMARAIGTVITGFALK